MLDKGGDAVCPHCGHSGNTVTESHWLLPGTKLLNRYLIGRVLGEGGFGITYIGLDTFLNLRVAVKEYYPHGVSVRNNERSSQVSAGSGSKRDFYEKGLQRFLTEARNLALFTDEPGIVSVRDYFEENDTAYIVMNYLDGVDLRAYLRQHGTFSADEACRMLRPIMQSLEAIHRTGIIHRDISPDNIMVLHNGQLRLMDFGAARDYSDDNRSMSVMLKQGYAPEEQYHRKGEQGPWTDVYGICATLYRCITGKTPDEALDRVFDDSLKRPSELGVAISPALEDALMYGLAVHKNNRCQNMTELMQLIDGALGAQAAPSPSADTAAGDAPDEALRTVYTELGDDRTVSADAAPLDPYASPQPYYQPAPDYSAFMPSSRASSAYSQQKPKKPLLPIIIGAALIIAVVVALILFFSNNPDQNSRDRYGSVYRYGSVTLYDDVTMMRGRMTGDILLIQDQ